MTDAPSSPAATVANPLLNLTFEPAFEALGEDYSDRVEAADFPHHILRFRNDQVLAQQVGVAPQQVSDADFVEAFGQFQAREPLLAMRNHGYQFGEYNPWLGDGRGFLYGQIRGLDGELYDFGTKGSGRTPYSRTADGRLTLKGGVREVLASEALHHMGVRTSRCFSLIETGEELWRGDEPSPTRSSVMVRFSRSHIRFGTFERLHAIQRPDLVQPLLDHVIAVYYPHLAEREDRYLAFYSELTERTAELVAQWMSVGFCHAVLNTDNMSITGESFDYGPYAFINNLDLNFTAAYFDHFGRYRFSNQPGICKWNLEMLQRPLAAVMPESAMASRLEDFGPLYHAAFRRRMVAKLGFTDSAHPGLDELLNMTLSFLQAVPISYHDFFAEVRSHFDPLWQVEADHILRESELLGSPELRNQLQDWRQLYQTCLAQLPEAEMAAVQTCLNRHNPLTVIVRPEVEAVWEPIANEDNWQPFYQLLEKLKTTTDFWASDSA